MSLELKPCPWCNSAARLADCSLGSFVYCPNEECFVQPETGTFENVSDAVAKWNTRHEGQSNATE